MVEKQVGKRIIFIVKLCKLETISKTNKQFLSKKNSYSYRTLYL